MDSVCELATNWLRVASARKVASSSLQGRIRTNPEALVPDSLHSEAAGPRLGFVRVRRYNVFMLGAHDSPLYSRVETVLASEIADGDLKVGDQLPTEDSLIERNEVSPNSNGKSA
jgi:hypothetical protein